MNPELEKYIDFVVADGEVTEKEKNLLIRKAQELNVDLDEMEIILDAKLHMIQKEAQPKEVQAEVPPPAENKPSLVKCPQCAAAIESFSTKCPYCDAEIRDIKTANSVIDFFNKVNELESTREENTANPFKAMGKMLSQQLVGNKFKNKKIALIQNFPVPNSKEDILEFLSLAVPLANKRGNFFTSQDETNKIFNEYVPVWHSKCQQIIMKARFSMKDDKALLNEIESYAKELKIK